MKYPKPTMEEPDIEELMEMEFEYGTCYATDGCTVEPDGVCEHGHPSWMMYWGVI